MTDELINKFYKIFDDGIVRQIKKLDVDCKKAERIRCSVTNNRRRKTLPRPYVIEAFKDYFDEDTYVQMYLKSYREYHNPNSHETDIFIKLNKKAQRYKVRPLQES
ncbi:Uncharacterised protein [Streptococcus agalactiae]|uniref:Uncharacterized protein n=1 Tax=Streptococcus agalactiae TaxID=1311 RepID=A0A7Z7KAM6_STRAG|nr:Uncharacterised protein [Streptococcus agalactiae]